MTTRIALLALAGLWMVACGGKGGDAGGEPVPEAVTPDPAVEDAHSDEVSARIKTGKEAIYACGGEEKAGGEAVYGKITMTFAIQPDGTIGKVQTEENGTGKVEIEACVTEVIKTWSFPPHPYGESIEYTYPFEVGF